MRYITLFFIFSWTSLQGQTPFNHRLENEQIQAFGHVVYELEDSYLGIGRGIDSIDYRRGIFATEFEKMTGEVLNTDKITFPNSLLFFNQLNSVLEINNNPHFLFNRSDTIYLTSYDDFEKELTIEKKIFSSVSTSSLFIYDFEKKGDNIYILAGHSTGQKNLVLIRYNTVEDSLTETFIYDELGYMELAKMILLDNDNFLITYRIYANEKFTQYVIEIEDNGELLWKYTHDDQRENVSFSFTSIGNGSYLIGGAKGKEFSTDPEGQQSPFLMKFDYFEKKIVKTTDFDIPQEEWFRWNDAVREIIPSHDSTSFLCVSKLYEHPINWDTLQSYGMIAKVDRDLNVIWRRNYARKVGEYTDNEFYDIIATSDGNYLAYGTSLKFTGTFPQDIPLLSWAIKIDEDGKIIGDTTTSTISWEYETLLNQVEIFPNPATNYISINQNELESITYRIFHSNGKIEDELKIDSPNTSVIKDISSWSKGMKYISILKGNKLLGHLKMIKN